MFQFQFEDLPPICINEPSSKLVQLLREKWETIHSRQDVFKYKITKLLEKYVANKYLLQLNPERGSLRRPPEHIGDICQPFNHDSFNFTKVMPAEVMFEITKNGDPDIHTVLVNVSPINQYHSLLCPSLDKCLPQVVTIDSLQLILEVAFLASNRDLRIGYNSLCAFASVNHLHYHLFLLSDKLPVETVKCQHLKGNLYIYDEENPTRGFVFQLKSKHQIVKISQDIFDLISLLIENNIAHNIFVTKAEDLEGRREEVLRIVLWPRKSSKGIEKINSFYVALCELSGWFPVYTTSVYENLQLQDIENELRKWKFDNFTELCQLVVKSNIMENKMDSK